MSTRATRSKKPASASASAQDAKGKGKGTAKPAEQKKIAGTKRKQPAKDDDDEDAEDGGEEDDEEEVDEQEARPKRRKAASGKPVSVATTKLDVMLAHTWKDGKDPTGWWISEKLDGVRYAAFVHGWY